MKWLEETDWLLMAAATLMLAAWTRASPSAREVNCDAASLTVRSTSAGSDLSADFLNYDGSDHGASLIPNICI